MTSYRKVSGTWRKTTAPYIKVAGTWKLAKSAWIKKDGTWKNWFLQGGSLDSSFVTSFTGGYVYETVLQSDGKVIALGEFTAFNGASRTPIVRLNANGTEDTSFTTNLGTGFVGLFDYTSVEGCVVQSDGKIVLAGWFTTFNGNTRNRLVRLNSDGTEDTAFYTNLGTGFGNDYPFALKLQSDGKILVGGVFTSFNGNTRNRLLRLNSNGTEDTGFYTNLGTGFSGSVYDVVIQSDGKILVGGPFTGLNGNTRNRLVRLNSDGTEDTSFYTNLGTGFNESVDVIAVQSDGKILVGGQFTSFNGNTRNKLVRLNSDGTEDTSFYTNLGTGFSGSGQINVYVLLIQTDGKIVVGGRFTLLNGNTRNYLLRLNSDGTEDTAFYSNMPTFNTVVVGGTIDETDDKAVLCGDFSITVGTNSYTRLAKISTSVT